MFSFDIASSDSCSSSFEQVALCFDSNFENARDRMSLPTKGLRVV